MAGLISTISESSVIEPGLTPHEGLVPGAPLVPSAGIRSFTASEELDFVATITESLDFTVTIEEVDS